MRMHIASSAIRTTNPTKKQIRSTHKIMINHLTLMSKVCLFELYNNLLTSSLFIFKAIKAKQTKH